MKTYRILFRLKFPSNGSSRPYSMNIYSYYRPYTYQSLEFDYRNVLAVISNNSISIFSSKSYTSFQCIYAS